MAAGLLEQFGHQRLSPFSLPASVPLALGMLAAVPNPAGNSIPSQGIYWLDGYTPAGYLSMMQDKAKASCLKRLNRIEGQVRGIARMIEEGRYCIDVVTQISAVRAALRRTEEEVLRDHVAHCVEHAIESGNAADSRVKVAELMNVLTRIER
jgi:DNA-binding FrmR family transcriptional regulator